MSTPWVSFPLFWLSYHHLPVWLYLKLASRVAKHDGYFATYFHPWEFYQLSEREVGESKYTLSKMLTLALNGITSFSVKPIYSILTTGLIFVLVSIGIGIYVIASLISGTAEHGWASLMLSIWFTGGIILFAIGIVGLYIGRIYIEVKQRLLYHIQAELL